MKFVRREGGRGAEMFLLCIMITTIVYLLYVLFIVDLYMIQKSIDILYIIKKIQSCLKMKQKKKKVEIVLQGDMLVYVWLWLWLMPCSAPGLAHGTAHWFEADMIRALQ